MIQLIISIILWCVFIIWRSYTDKSKIEKGKKIDHTFNALNCLFMALLHSKFGVKSFYLTPALLTSYWLFFDMLLNKLRGKELLYLGTTAFLDRIFKSKYSQLAVKIICLAISIVIYISFKK